MNIYFNPQDYSFLGKLKYELTLFYLSFSDWQNVMLTSYNPDFAEDFFYYLGRLS